MDPLSVALVVVSLTTAVKDLVEFGQKIHQSFAKVSNNLYRAQRVAEEIQEMVGEIKDFCDEHKDALADMKDFCLALQGLLDKFRSFEMSILPLLPQTGGRRRDRFFRGWDAWRNNNKIEGSIVDLQSDIVKVMRRHIMKSAMRTEVKLETIHQETSRGFTGVHKDITHGLEVLEVVRRDVSALRLTTAATTVTQSEAVWATSDEFNRNVIMFATSTPSTSAPMLRTPNVITEALMTTAYIRLQVNSIAMSIEKMSELRVSTLNIDSAPDFGLIPLLKPASMNIMHLRHHVVRQVTNIRDLLDTERTHTISVYEGANELNNLSAGLEALGMAHESILVGKWAITLVRLLVDASGGNGNDPDLEAALALFLRNQSSRYDCSGDKVQSLLAAEEAYKISQNLQDQYEKDADFQILHSDVLSQYARLVDNQSSIGMTFKALDILEDVLGVRALSSQWFTEAAQPISAFLDHLFSSAPKIYPIISYARTLHRLGTYAFKGGRPDSALKMYRLAIAMRRKLVSAFGHEYTAELTIALSSLVKGESAGCIPAEELVDMVNECVQLLRGLVERNPPRYARDLVSVLWVKATTLDRLHRDAEAIATWEEVASLADQIIQDSAICATALGNLSRQFRRLKRHDDAVRVGTLAITTYSHRAEIQASRYLDLSGNLRELRRYKESAEAARTSVMLFRQLAMRDLGTWTTYLTAALSALASCLATLGDYSEALIAWNESMSLLVNLLNTDPDISLTVIEKYLTALSVHPSFNNILKDGEECVKVWSTAVRYVHQLSETHPQNIHIIRALFKAEFCYAYTMLRVGSLQSGQQYVDDWLDAWNRKPSEIVTEVEIAHWHATMVTLKADVLDSQGCTEQALLATQKVYDIVNQSATTYQPCFSKIVDSMVREARFSAILGNTVEAQDVAEGALQRLRGNKLDPTIVDDLILALYGVASIALSCQNYNRAIEAAREVCKIYGATDPKCWHSGGDSDGFIHPSLFATLAYAEANLGRCTSALEYGQCAVTLSLDIRDTRGAPTAAERSYMETRGVLADILLATGDISQARQIHEERRVYFSKRVEKRMGDYRELAPILRMLGILYCSEGRHEDGGAAAEELSRIINMLQIAFPSLQEQVKNRLRNHIKVPILKVLNDMTQKLDCKHQTEILSCFAN
ncbi:hypothetical protein D9619_004745 [Psilocybe cf. subviscida]|uniref:Uncharacterized protein n=1 Tax=Psilocybe cf. subviscida TaxID=2480587 RepID=A0A8H5F7Q6_9AGAR|nr:hypothetical protein D9619_004745 [Psilocybe cf. subviscida]